MASSSVQTSYDSSDVNVNVLNAKILKPLDEVLRCHICFDYFSNCMITKCSHNYCSVCIRRYMTYKSQCPTCFQEATEPELQNNRLIDEILRIYKRIQENLQIQSESTNISFPEKSARSGSIKKEKQKKPVKAEACTHVESDQRNEGTSSDDVSCPVCYITVPNSRINIHLDSCLKQTEERNQRKFLPKMVYHLLSDKEIKKKLKEHGLSTSGNRQALIRRHKNFIILYNANCDSLNPKEVSDLVLEIEQQELEEKVNAYERTTQVNKKSDPSVIEKEHESYVQEHKSQFSALIQEVQQRVLDERRIKTEIDTSEVSSNIVDENGKVIGESTLRVGDVPDSVTVTIKEEPPDSPLQKPVVVNEEPPESLFEGPVTVKEEFSESLLKDEYIMSDPDDGPFMTQTPILDHNISDKGVSKTSYLPFHIKKDLPAVKIKDEAQFLLDSTAKQDFPSSNSSSLEEFEINKMVLNKYHKKKYARRLSTEEKNTQRKK